jgi:hypothetical protein
MDVYSGFHLVVHYSRFGTRDDTSPFLDYGMHRHSEFEDSFVWESLLTLVVKIDEKLKNVRLLLHDV